MYPHATTLVDPTFEERYFKLLVSSISDYAIYLLTPAGAVSSWNAGAQQLKGFHANEVIGKHFSMFYTPEDQAADMPARALQSAFSDGHYQTESWRVRKDGTRFWANVVIDPIHDDQGVFIGFAKVTRDITERRALEETERKFRLLVQGVSDYALYLLSPEGLVDNWNQGAERIKGYAEGEIIGKHFSTFYTPEDCAAGVPQKALHTARTVGRYEAEGWRVRKGGARFWAHVVIDALFEEGQLIGFAKITRDISEKKAAAEALEKANVALFKAQKMEAVGQLTGGIAHDFNNLLGVLSNGLDVMVRGELTHTETRMVESMRRAIKRGSTLTQQLLAFARRQPLKPEAVDLNQLILSFEPVLRRAGTSSVDLETTLAAQHASITIDAARFEAALLNLVLNACDAMPHGGQIVIATRDVELRDKEVNNLPAGRYVVVDVQDTGSGIPQDIQDRIFEPFFTTKDAGKGTGLGLSQVYGFIAQSGGDVTVHSDGKFGAAFQLYLPVSINSAAQRPESHVAARAKLLLVEDEPDVLEVTAELLRTMGYEVLTAASGKDAIERLRRSPDIDILFSDVVLEMDINGIQLAQYVQKKHPGVKILLASGYALPMLKANHADLSQFPFVNKPYGVDQLQAHFDALLRDGSAPMQ